MRREAAAPIDQRKLEDGVTRIGNHYTTVIVASNKSARFSETG